jgi:hypothetical protein
MVGYLQRNETRNDSQLAELIMYKSIDLTEPHYLDPGYYILKIALQEEKRTKVSLFLESGDHVANTAAFELERSGSALLRLRQRIRLRLGADSPTASSPPHFGCRRLWRPVGAIAKSFNRRKLQHRIAMGRAGYVCVLSGVNDNWAQELAQRARIQQSLTIMRLDDASVGSCDVFDNPQNWLGVSGNRPVSRERCRMCVVLHLYYTELWPELAVFLSQIQWPFDLLITHCGLDGGVEKQILELFPFAKLLRFENRGRDILPFISLLNEGRLDKYEYICKIHSKRSVNEGSEQESLLGSRWRRRALYDLLAAGRAREIARMFEGDPRLGIVGPRALRLPSALYTVEKAWGVPENRRLTLELAKCMGATMAAERLDFFAGSMFWARRRALQPIRELNLERGDFPEELGQRDGQLHHALERVICVSSLHAGLTIADVPPLDVRRAFDNRPAARLEATGISARNCEPAEL